MPVAGDPPDPTRPPAPPGGVEALLRAVVGATGKAVQRRAIGELARFAAAAGRHADVFRRLADTGPDGPRLALEFALRLPDPLPVDLMRSAVVLLSNRGVPVPVRVAAAGKMLSAVPDEPRTVTPVVRTLTAGLTRSRALERMLQLQSRVEACHTLDRMIGSAAGKVRLKCPRCPAKLGRADFIVHLWHKHHLAFEQGRAVEPRPLVEDVINAAAGEAGTVQPAALDRTFFVSGHYYPDADPLLVLQALSARGAADPTQTDRLLAHAAADHAGLCPVCLAAVPDPVPPLPPPASLADGRLVADGYLVAVEDSARGRVVTIASPGAATEVAPDDGPRATPRQAAALAGAAAFTAAAVVVLMLPVRLASPVVVAGVLAAVGLLLYLAVRVFRKPLADPTDRAVDVAWAALVPGIGRSPDAVRFLTRLCRVSVGAGSAVERSTAVFEVVEHAAVLADKGGMYVELLAAARVLQVLDAARLGREKVSGLVGVFEPFLRGELSPAYAEAAAETLLTIGALSAGDAGRLAALLVAVAFENGLTPAGLVTVARFCPWFRRTVFEARPAHLGHLYAVWRGRLSRPWEAVGPATTVFDLAHESPVAGRRVLADQPDTLLQIDFDEATEAATGAVVLMSGGLSVAGCVVADPDAPIELTRGPGDGWRLRFGRHRLVFGQKVPAGIVGELRAWLRYRAERLLPAVEQQERRGAGRPAVALLAPLAVACPLCEARSVIRTGQLGTPWQAVAGAVG